MEWRGVKFISLCMLIVVNVFNFMEKILLIVVLVFFKGFLVKCIDDFDVDLVRV